MREFTDRRTADTDDELWLLEHPAVYTLGQAGRREHLLDPGDTPVVQTDRGGQVTWHGPGQLVIYTLIDLRRAGYGIRELVIRLENALIGCLAEFGIAAVGRRDAPGVYVQMSDEQPGAKIAALGLRVRRGCTYHGLALNHAPDLAAFRGIDPCGYRNLAVTSIAAEGVDVSRGEVESVLLKTLHTEIQAQGR